MSDFGILFGGARFRAALCIVACISFAAGCAGRPPGAKYPKAESIALANPEETRLGAQFASAAQEHGGTTGFRILNAGVDGFLTRVQMINAAERTIDVQYFIFRGDETGRLITAALMRAADRGVRVRVLLDDGDTVAGDEQVLALLGHPTSEVRIFNPFAYRGHVSIVRYTEFALNRRRLDYRMHNKLMIVDNSIALIGGRNVGKQYFQMGTDSQFADDDVFTAGPVVQRLSATFDEFWASKLAIPAQALSRVKLAPAKKSKTQVRALNLPGIDYDAMLESDQPFAGIISGDSVLTWANATVICDSPEKKKVHAGLRPGRLMENSVADEIAVVQHELLMTTPYFVPARDEVNLLTNLLHNGAKVGILTNSLLSAEGPVPQAGYSRYRMRLLKEGAELYEVRAQLGSVRGSGQSASISRFGTFGLHAKAYIFDRQKLFLGSMNFDQRSKRLNTEIGLIIESPVLANQMAGRFEAMTRPESAYVLTLRDKGATGTPRMVWDTVENGKPVEYEHEPSRSAWQRFKQRLLALLPLGSEL